ncbi:hypothetical protein TSMEX_009602 [Taenia solium]
MSPAPICTNGNYEVHPINSTHPPTNKQNSDFDNHVLTMRCIRVIKVRSPPTLRRRRTQPKRTLEYFAKYMQFGGVNPDTAASIATTVVHAAVDATSSSTTRIDCSHQTNSFLCRLIVVQIFLRPYTEP